MSSTRAPSADAAHARQTYSAADQGGDDDVDNPVSEAQHGCIAAVIENRAREVGLAILDPTTLVLRLAQFIEAGRSYTSTRLLARLHDVTEFVVVVSENAQQAFGATGVNAALAGHTRHGMPRGAFDDSKGHLLLVDTLAVEGCRASLTAAATRGAHYLAFGAAGALLQHMSQDGGLFLRSGCLNVEFVGTGNHMHLDSGTIDALEILRPASATSGTSGTGANKHGGSLLRMMDRTRTVAGSRLLRANLLQPLTDIPTLQARYDTLDELLESEALVYDTSQCVSALPKDLDRLCCSLAVRPTKKNTDAAGRQIGALASGCIRLREALRSLPALADALAPAQSALLVAMHASLTNAAYEDMLLRIDEVLADEASSSKTAFINHIQQCFAVKPTADSFLALTRNSFCRITESIHELAEQYRATHQLDSLKACYSNKRGFYLSLPTHAGKGSERVETILPRSFLLLERRGRTAFLCTTHELIALNARLKDAANDCLMLTETVLEGLIQHLVEHMALLQRLVDTVALLDMLLAFVSVVTSAPDAYVRPGLHEHGPLVIVGGRHALMERLSGGAAGAPDVRSNDAFASSTCSLHLVTGPNMSGKSTYLKQVALAVVMAQVGCFVPAEFMAMSPFDSLFSHMAGAGDSIETNSSSFMVEMQDVAHILEHATCRSLVLIDELGRATSTADGVAIAWAVCEHLLGTGALTFFATHFGALAGVAELYPAAKLWRLQVDTAHERLNFSWRVQEGRAPGEDSHYGLLLAATVGIPHSILQHARRAAERVEAAERRRVPPELDAHPGWAALYTLMQKLITLAQRTGLPPEGGTAGGTEGDGGTTGSALAAAESARAQWVQHLRELQPRAQALPLERLALEAQRPRTASV